MIAKQRAEAEQEIGNPPRCREIRLLPAHGRFARLDLFERLAQDEQAADQPNSNIPFIAVGGRSAAIRAPA
jgi:hypothetical protein